MDFTEGQKRHLSVCFGGLERETAQTIDWLDAQHFPEPVRANILAGLRAIQDASRSVSIELKIETSIPEPDPIRHFAAWATAWWSTILDCRSSALRAYGPVDPHLRDILDPQIEKLAGILLGLGRAAEHGAVDQQPHDPDVR